MKIAILSRSPESYSTRRLVEASKKRRHLARVLDPLRFTIMLEQDNPALYYGSRTVDNYDAVIPRIGASITFYGLAVLRQFEQMGVFTPNESVSIARSRDKLRAQQVLCKHDIGMPPTAFVRNKKDVLPAIERVGGAPVIIKVLEGTQGVGVILAESVKTAQSIIETLQSASQNVLIQKFVEESKGRDIRAFVVGDRVIAAMRRRAVGDEFRSNVHRGGQTEVLDLTPEYQQTAVKAAQIVGLRIAGVDMLEGKEGPQVMEVNSSPGLEGIETATGADVAGAIIEEIENQVLFPDVDLRQRLRLTGGYGIGEFVVHNMPEWTGKAIRDLDLHSRHIHIISIERPDRNITMPHGDTVIQEGDELLCYGLLHELRSLIPKDAPRKKKKAK